LRRDLTANVVARATSWKYDSSATMPDSWRCRLSTYAAARSRTASSDGSCSATLPCSAARRAAVERA
jgi:hypothetical protein